MKKWTNILLINMMLISSLGLVSCKKSTSNNISPFYYRINYDENEYPVSATIIGFDDYYNRKEVKIAPQIYDIVNGYVLDVTTIGNGAFENKDCIYTIIIPDCVTTIESCAFKDCDNIMSITIPDSVTSIAIDAFSDMDKLTEIYDLSSIGDKSYVPDGVSLYTSSSDTPIVFEKDGNYYRYIDGVIHLFNSKNEDAVVVLPDKLSYNGKTYDSYVVDDDAFIDNPNMCVIYVPDNTNITISYDNVNYHHLQKIYRGATSLIGTNDIELVDDKFIFYKDKLVRYIGDENEVILPKDRQYSIDKYAFDNKNIIKLDIPSTASYDDDTFDNLVNLVEIVKDEEKVLSKEYYIDNKGNLYVKEDDTYHLKDNIRDLREIKLPNYILVDNIKYEYVIDESFLDSKVLRYLTLPDFVNEYDADLVKNTSNLVYLQFGEKIEKITSINAPSYNKIFNALIFGTSVKTIEGTNFGNIDKIYYMSTKDEFEKINITGNIDNIVPYYYSEQQPQDLDKHWYFDYTNKPLPWQRYD